MMIPGKAIAPGWISQKQNLRRGVLFMGLLGECSEEKGGRKRKRQGRRAEQECGSLWSPGGDLEHRWCRGSLTWTQAVSFIPRFQSVLGQGLRTSEIGVKVVRVNLFDPGQLCAEEGSRLLPAILTCGGWKEGTQGTRSSYLTNSKQKLYLCTCS